MTATERAAIPDPRELAEIRDQAKRECEPFNDMIYKLSLLIKLKFWHKLDGTIERIRDDEIEDKIDEVRQERDEYIKRKYPHLFNQQS